MDIEQNAMSEKNTLDFIQRNDLDNFSTASNYSNKSTIFDFLFFWSIFILSVSCFLDLIVFFCYYQEKHNDKSYDALTFFFRIVSDALFIAPLLIYIRFALESTSKNYVLGIFVFLPQLVLSLISIIKLNTQEFIIEKQEEKSKSPNNTEIMNGVELFNMFLSNNTSNDTSQNTTSNDLTNYRVTILKISPIVNIAFYTITVILTFLKVYKNF